MLWGVPDVQWPEPFSSFASVLEMFNFFVVGTSCISDGYNYYIQIFIVTLTPIALSAILVVVGCIRLRCVTAQAGGSVGGGGEACAVVGRRRLVGATVTDELDGARARVIDQRHGRDAQEVTAWAEHVAA